MNISKNHLKLITNLHQKKYRQNHKLFVAEGVKVIKEFLNSSFELHQLFSVGKIFEDIENTVFIDEKELKKISRLTTPNKVVAIFRIPEVAKVKIKGLSLALDTVNDPGNLGTIIRLCDWFGISTIICSTDTVDCYNSKVVQACMGSLTRVSLSYLDLKTCLKEIGKPVFIADTNGENVYKTSLPKESILVMGNEANGVSDEIKEMATHTLAIPRFGNLQQTESLNVATAAAIFLSEFRRSI